MWRTSAPQLKRQPLGSAHGTMAQRFAYITWSAARMTAGLPMVQSLTRPARLAPDLPPWGDDAWSLVCVFDPPPAVQGNPSLAHVSFLMKEAPQDWLAPGRTLWMLDADLGWAEVSMMEEVGTA